MKRNIQEMSNQDEHVNIAYSNNKSSFQNEILNKGISYLKNKNIVIHVKYCSNLKDIKASHIEIGAKVAPLENSNSVIVDENHDSQLSKDCERFISASDLSPTINISSTIENDNPKSDENTKKEIIITDLENEYCPIYGEIKMAKIYYEKVPRGCLISPFDKITEDFQKHSFIEKNTKNRQILIRRVENNGYCEQCKCYFRSACEHHNSKEHVEIVESDLWSDFDRLSKEIGFSL